jgi:archaellin
MVVELVNTDFMVSMVIGESSLTLVNNTITIDDLKEGETWKYSFDGGITFKSSTGGSFTLDDNIYVADAIQNHNGGYDSYI